MSKKLVLTILLLTFPFPSYAVLIQVDGSGENYYGQDPTDPTFRFSAIYDTETPGLAETPSRVNYFDALSSFVVWSSVASTPFTATDRRFDFGSGAIGVANDDQGLHSKADSFTLGSDTANLNGIDNLRAGIFLATDNLNAVASTRIPLTLELSDFDPAIFFMATPSTSTPNNLEVFQAGIITTLVFTPVTSASVPEPASLALFGTAFLLTIGRKRSKSIALSVAS